MQTSAHLTSACLLGPQFELVHIKWRLCLKNRLGEHVHIHPDSQKYLLVAMNKVCQLVLPFGLNTAPQVFTRLGHTVAGYLHCQEISVLPYLDDCLVDLFLWLHYKDIVLQARHIPGCLSVIAVPALSVYQHGMESPSRDSCSNL